MSGIVVMMNGLPGAMGIEVSQVCLQRGFALAPIALTGPGGPPEVIVRKGSHVCKVKLVDSSGVAEQKAALDEMVKEFGSRLVIVDFTHPSAVNPNAELYAAAGAAFVMGTTGGDQERLMKTVTDGNVYAVIAPNMAKQIVAFQATMERMARDFPGAFSGYTMTVKESHQKTKADTSGTAKEMVQSFKRLGIDFDVEQIQKLRDDQSSTGFGVPPDSLDGHAFHTYTLQSPDKSVEFQFKHNVCGRRTYAEGVADAVQFLAARRAEGSTKKIFNMIDILESGAMR